MYAIFLFSDDEAGGFKHTQQILDELGVVNATETDYQNVKLICCAVSERAAFLASAGERVQLLRSNPI